MIKANFTLANSLFGIVKFTKNAYPNKYSYSRYGIAFDAYSAFSLSWGVGFGKNVVIFRS